MNNIFMSEIMWLFYHFILLFSDKKIFFSPFICVN